MRIGKAICCAIMITICLICLLQDGIVRGASGADSESKSNCKLEVTVLDLPGGGDCTIIRYGDCQILVDAGENTPDNKDLIKKSILEKKSAADKIWDYCIFTHPDSDHIGCSGYVLNVLSYTEEEKKEEEKLNIGTIIDFDFKEAKDYYKTDVFDNYINDREAYREGAGCNYFSAASLSKDKKEQVFTLGNDCKLKILYNYYDNKENHSSIKNNLSVCFLIEFGEQKLLFTGDLEQAGENKLMTYHAEELKNVTFFKAGHHGSATSNTESFVDLIRPNYVAITCEQSAVLSGRSMNNFLRFTDYIFPNRVDIDCRMFGTTTYVFDGKSVNVIPESNLSAKTIRDAVINENGVEVNWYETRIDDIEFELEDTLSVYTFDEGKPSYSNCTLVKYGHIDILIDCGSTLSSDEFVKILKQYVVDGIIEYVIVTHFHTANISQLVRNNYAGVFDSFKIGSLCDSSVTLFDKNNTRIYSKYLDVTSSDTFSENKIHLDSGKTEQVEVVKNRLNINLLAGTKAQFEDEDDCSMCALITFREEKLLFVGDLTDFSDLSSKLDISGLTFYRASNSAISYSNESKRNAYESALQNMRPLFTVIGSALGYRMPSGALFGSEQYQERLRVNNPNTAAKVYGIRKINSMTEDDAANNGSLLFLIQCKKDDVQYEMISLKNKKVATVLK